MKKVAKLLEERQKINKKIEDIQKKCPHFNTTVKQVRENLDSSSPVIRYVCDECLKILGYPTQQEIKKYLNG
jgi:cyclopropane fatty-acyl-phospholipid synthase-like methyltransferase